jgi:beta-N-acetylhexosaminidase
MRSYTTSMALEEQIGQLLVVGFWGTTPSPEIIDLIRNYHIGGIILFSRNVQDAQQVLELTHSLQMIAKTAGHPAPLLIAIDQENGIVQRLGQGTTLFPGNMALGAIGSEQIVYDVAQATGRELKALGINMNLAPVVDVNNNPANPVIGVRSFGEDPHEVARLAAAAVKGYRAAGVLSDLKHFPGHGDTAVDSHLALPTISSTLEQLEAIELVPFKSGIEAGADSVMIAHISFPALTHQEALPATVSPAIVRGLLREKLGFDGVIISDCMEMNAVAETIGTERAAVMALQAGVDLVLVSHTYARQRGSSAAIQMALQTSELSPEMVRLAAERVLTLKDRFLSWDSLLAAPVPEWVGGPSHQHLRDQAYEQSTTQVRNEDALLPLRLEQAEKVLVISPSGEAYTRAEDRRYPNEFLALSISQRHDRVSSMFTSPSSIAVEREEILRTASASDLIIMATLNAHLDQQQAELMRNLLQAGRRVIGIAVGNPYDLLAFPQLRSYLVTYEYTRPALAAAVRVLFGEIQPNGHLPVSLPGLYPASRAPRHSDLTDDNLA